MTKVVIDESFTGIGSGTGRPIKKCFNFSVSGFTDLDGSTLGVATVNFERSRDDGVTWRVVESFTTNAERNGKHAEGAYLYRFNCVAHTSGTIQCEVTV